MSHKLLILPFPFSPFSSFPPAFEIHSPRAATGLTKPAQKFNIPTRPAVA